MRPCLRSDPFGFRRAEAIGNSLEDSVSFRFPSRRNLEGGPGSPAKFASSPAHPRVVDKGVRRGLNAILQRSGFASLATDQQIIRLLPETIDLFRGLRRFRYAGDVKETGEAPEAKPLQTSFR
jgi:hypothetical protein